MPLETPLTADFVELCDMKNQTANLSSAWIHANIANSLCASATGHTSSALFNRSVSFNVTLHTHRSLRGNSVPGRSGLLAWRPNIFCIQWHMLHHGQGWDVYVYTCNVDMFLCMWASVCCFRGCVDRTRRMRPVCSVFPAFVLHGSPSSALHFLPSSTPL